MRRSWWGSQGKGVRRRRLAATHDSHVATSPGAFRRRPGPRVGQASHQQPERLDVNHAKALALIEAARAGVDAQHVECKRSAGALGAVLQVAEDRSPEPSALPRRSEFDEHEIQLIVSVLHLEHPDPLAVDLDYLTGSPIEAIREHPPLRLVIPSPRLVDVLPEGIAVQCERPLEVRGGDWSEAPRVVRVGHPGDRSGVSRARDAAVA